jgi:hypothetical protein
MEDLTALFHQYETDYCNKSTDISRKITSIAGLTGGACWCCSWLWCSSTCLCDSMAAAPASAGGATTPRTHAQARS